MRILSVGDSFTYGEELVDQQSAWPYRLGDKYHAEVINLGEPAASNDKIVRKTLDYLINNGGTIDLVVIGWASPGRSEFADEFGYYDIWPGYQGTLFIKDGHNWRLNLCGYISKYHNREFYYIKYIQQIILLQSFLNTLGIKYIMLDVLHNDYYKKNIKELRDNYVNLIDKDKFLGFDSKGMCEWAYGCKKGLNGHFLEEGHQIVADKIYDHIRHLGWFS
jgi:hypothetical protein